MLDIIRSIENPTIGWAFYAPIFIAMFLSSSEHCALSSKASPVENIWEKYEIGIYIAAVRASGM